MRFLLKVNIAGDSGNATAKASSARPFNPFWQICSRRPSILQTATVSVRRSFFLICKMLVKSQPSLSRGSWRSMQASRFIRS
jgi:hypothetical protein